MYFKISHTMVNGLFLNVHDSTLEKDLNNTATVAIMPRG